MSHRVAEDGRDMFEKDHLGVLRLREGVRARPYHRPRPGVPAGFSDVDRCLTCGRTVYRVATGMRDRTAEGGTDGHWRHEPDTFWTSR
jgi:hypothetical protein